MPSSFDPQRIVTEYARTLIRVKAKQVVRRPGFSRCEQADIEQDLVLHLLCQAKHFDPERSSLNTFIARVVDSAVAMLVRERGAAKRNPPQDLELKSLNEKMPQADGPPESLARLIDTGDLQRRIGVAPLSDAELFELVEDVTSVILTLPPELQDVCRSLFTRNRRETKENLDVSRRKLKAAIDVIREYFEESGFSDS